MKVALPVWENRVSPVFDFAHALLVAEIENLRVRGKQHMPVDPHLPPFSQAAKLSSLGVETLICGAVSQMLEEMIKSYGIRVISAVSGDIDEVLQAHLNGTLSTAKYRMPGMEPKGTIEYEKVR
jgi:predicted Fe-Mo cluster-binding NifX family protein